MGIFLRKALQYVTTRRTGMRGVYPKFLTVYSLNNHIIMISNSITVRMIRIIVLFYDLSDCRVVKCARYFVNHLTI